MRFDEVDSNLFGKIQLHTLRRKATNLILNLGNLFCNSIDEGRSVQDKESLENPFNEIVVSKPDNESDLELEVTTDTELSSTEDIHPLAVQEPPQDSDIRQLIREECCEHEVKNVVEQPAEHGSRSIQSLQNFKVIHKSFISFKDTSQISSIHSVAPIQSTKEPEHLLSMRYEHLSITPKTESDEVIESNAENLLPIPSKCEVTLKDEIECDMPAKDMFQQKNSKFIRILFAKINFDKLDPHCFNVESDFVESLLNRDTFIDFSSKFDFSGELAHIKLKIPKSDFDFEEEIRHIKNLLYDNSFPRPPKELNAEIADTIIESIPLPIPVQDEGDIRFQEELLINDFILSDELSDANFEENPLIPRPPPKPPDVETNAGEEIAVVMIDKDKFDDEFQFFMFAKVFSLLSAESENTIFDPGISD
nr:hypothetical protein [Tanacetum cinerariifolium]